MSDPGSPDSTQNDRTEAIPDRGPLPGDAYTDRQLFQHVLRRLSGPCRKLLCLLFRDELSPAEAAAALDITEGNLRVRLNRCRDRAVSIRDQTLAG